MYAKIHDFTGGLDGANPYAGLTMDKGNLYGTAFQGGPGASYGTVFKLRRSGSTWIFNPLYSFNGGNDGFGPYLARVLIGTDGSLYGTTVYGGGGYEVCGGGCGTVFNLRPPPTACKTALCPWTETVLYRFTGGASGMHPTGDPIFDKAGNIYGNLAQSNNGLCNGYGCGLVYQLTPSNGNWTESILYTFAGGNDGASPIGGVIFDKAGNLYGTTYLAGDLACNAPYGCGTVYQLIPSEPGWTENTLYSFQGGSDGSSPVGGLIFDESGNLYGPTSAAYELTLSDGHWVFTVLHSLSALEWGSLAMDAAGNLYGTTAGGGAYGYGSVFKLTPFNGGWTYIDLYDFCSRGSPCTDGANPYSTLVLDSAGNLYGTAENGGANGYGVVWEITP